MQNDILLAAIIESAGLAIVSSDLDGLIVTWNPAAEQLFGYTEQNAIGRHICIIFAHKLQLLELELIEMVLTGKRVGFHPTVLVTRSGKEISAGVTFSAVVNRNKQLIGVSYNCWPPQSS